MLKFLHWFFLRDHLNISSDVPLVTISFDIFWLIISKTKPSDFTRSRITKVVSIMIFSNWGCSCVSTCNLEQYHHTKRVSIKCRARKFIKGIKVKCDRNKLFRWLESFLETQLMKMINYSCMNENATCLKLETERLQWWCDCWCDWNDLVQHQRE